MRSHIEFKLRFLNNRVSPYVGACRQDVQLMVFVIIKLVHIQFKVATYQKIDCLAVCSSLHYLCALLIIF